MIPEVPLTVEGASVLHQMMRLRRAAWHSLNPESRHSILEETIAALSALEAHNDGRQSAVFSLLGHKGDLLFVFNLAPGFPTREELKARYAERSGRDLSALDFYIALGYWKLAIILEGVFARYTAGGYGKVNEGVEAFARLVERLAEEAERVEREG